MSYGNDPSQDPFGQPAPYGYGEQGGYAQGGYSQEGYSQGSYPQDGAYDSPGQGSAPYGWQNHGASPQQPQPPQQPQQPYSPYRSGGAPQAQQPYGYTGRPPYMPYGGGTPSGPFDTAAPKRGGNGVKIAIGVTAAIIAIFIAIGWGFAYMMRSMTEAAITHATSAATEDLRRRGYDPDNYVDANGRVTDEQVYRYSDSEDFQQYKSAVDTMYAKYMNMSDDELKDTLPEFSEEGVKQFGAFLTILADLKSANAFGDSRTTTDPQEITDYYQGQIDYLDELEQRLLNGEPLGTSVRIKTSDGRVIEVDGDKEPAYTKPDDVNATIAQWEHNITAVPITQGADGTYLETGEALAKAVGLTPNYDFQSVHQVCSSGRLGDDRSLGAYCPVTQDIIYINQGLDDFDAQISDIYYPNAVKHELAHALIHRICGTTQPPLGVDPEALTNSYATLYFGADRDMLQHNAEQGATWYVMTDASDEAARRVHTGQCQVN
ncbi:hypothetical protein B1526_0476 [Bifidobacterium criceti]|uniref:Uncharacterized protein n=2 Tax=Bifidobacterium criceti TaxID=1960969 RepID=A0A2A2EH12_9BIFI|nr:hypothetical protein B1526_0476 [Bifidobacterium criceti]